MDLKLTHEQLESTPPTVLALADTPVVNSTPTEAAKTSTFWQLLAKRQHRQAEATPPDTQDTKATSLRKLSLISPALETESPASPTLESLLNEPLTLPPPTCTPPTDKEAVAKLLQRLTQNHELFKTPVTSTPAPDSVKNLESASKSKSSHENPTVSKIPKSLALSLGSASALVPSRLPKKPAQLKEQSPDAKIKEFQDYTANLSDAAFNLKKFTYNFLMQTLENLWAMRKLQKYNRTKTREIALHSLQVDINQINNPRNLAFANFADTVFHEFGQQLQQALLEQHLSRQESMLLEFPEPLPTDIFSRKPTWKEKLKFTSFKTEQLASLQASKRLQDYLSELKDKPAICQSLPFLSLKVPGNRRQILSTSEEATLQAQDNVAYKRYQTYLQQKLYHGGLLKVKELYVTEQVTIEQELATLRSATPETLNLTQQEYQQRLEVGATISQDLEATIKQKEEELAREAAILFANGRYFLTMLDTLKDQNLEGRYKSLKEQQDNALRRLADQRAHPEQPQDPHLEAFINGLELAKQDILHYSKGLNDLLRRALTEYPHLRAQIQADKLPQLLTAAIAHYQQHPSKHYQGAYLQEIKRIFNLEHKPAQREPYELQIEREQGALHITREEPEEHLTLQIERATTTDVLTTAAPATPSTDTSSRDSSAASLVNDQGVPDDNPPAPAAVPPPEAPAALNTTPTFKVDLSKIDPAHFTPLIPATRAEMTAQYEGYLTANQHILQKMRQQTSPQKTDPQSLYYDKIQEDLDWWQKKIRHLAENVTHYMIKDDLRLSNRNFSEGIISEEHSLRGKFSQDIQRITNKTHNLIDRLLHYYKTI